MSGYLDTSFIVASLVTDLHSSRASAFLQTSQDEMLISDFAAAEFSAVIGRHVRMGKATKQAGQAAFASFDAWAYQFARRTETTAADMRMAEAFIRRLDLNLRAPDALHIAMAHRRGATLVTFDQNMAAGAAALGVNVAVT